MTTIKAIAYLKCKHCKRSAAKKKLFICHQEGCDDFGEMYCVTCGAIAHTESDHRFGPTEHHVTPVALELVLASLKNGLETSKSTLGYWEEQKNGEVRHIYTGAVVSVANGTFAANSASVTLRAKKVYDLVKTVKDTSVTASALMGTTTDVALEVVKKSLPGAAIGAGVMFGFEVVLHSVRFYRGEITSWKEFGYHISKGLAAAVGMGVGNCGGAALGAAIGSLGGPIGAVIGGIIGAIAGGIVGQKLTTSVFEQYIWRDDFIHDEQKQRTELIKKALALYGIVDVKDIDNPLVFNEDRLRRKYRELAKIYHPDKNNGSLESHAKFAEICAALGVLLALLDKKHKKNSKIPEKIKQVKAITYKNDVSRLSKILKTEDLASIVKIFKKRNAQYTLEYISKLGEADLSAIIQDMNADADFPHRISAQKKKKLLKMIQAWRDWNCVDDQNDVNAIRQIELDMKANDDDDDTDVETIRAKLQEKQLFYIVELLCNLEADLTLEELVGYSKDDLLELCQAVNDDEGMNRKISVIHKNRFVRIVSG